MWINRHKMNNSLAVVVHGLRGQPLADLQKCVQQVQDFCHHQSRVRSFDMYLFGCRVAGHGQTLWQSATLDALREVLDSTRIPYQTAVLIGFHDGGIVAKRYVLRELEEGRGHVLKVDRIVTVGTDHRRYVPLADEWRDPPVAALSCPPRAVRRYIHSTAVVTQALRDVRATSQAGFAPVDQAYYLKGALPTSPSRSRSELLAEVIRGQLYDHLAASIEAIEAEINRLVTDRIAYDDYVRNYGGTVARAVRRGIKWLASRSDGIEIKTASLLADFLKDYRQRPLRGLAFAEALDTYAKRQAYQAVEV
jgi:hypothetical protein